jgi:hypothetical protein
MLGIIVIIVVRVQQSLEGCHGSHGELLGSRLSFSLYGLILSIPLYSRWLNTGSLVYFFAQTPVYERTPLFVRLGKAHTTRLDTATAPKVL